MINWKVVIGSGAVAVVLSLLTGIISGVSLGILLLRALLWGAIFSGIGAGISVLISKYLPELLSTPTGGEQDDAQAKRTVDIVLPDENPHASEETGADEYNDDYSPDFQVSDEPDELSGDVVETSTTTDSMEPDRNAMVEEVEQVREGGAGTRKRSSPTFSAFETPDAAEELPDFESADGDFSSSDDLESFPSERLSDVSRLSGAKHTVDVLGHQADADEIAKAIRTALKKDQKG